MEIIKRNVITLAREQDIVNNIYQIFNSVYNISFVKQYEDVFSLLNESGKTFSLIFVDIEDKEIKLKDFLLEKKKDVAHIAIPVIGLSKKKQSVNPYYQKVSPIV